MTLNTQSIAAIVRQLAAIAGIVLASVPTDGVPASARWWLGLGGAAIIAVEHYVGDPSTGSTVPPSTTSGPPPSS